MRGRCLDPKNMKKNSGKSAICRCDYHAHFGQGVFSAMFDWRMVESDDRRRPIVQRETNPSSYQSLGHPWGHGACWTFLGSVEGKILSGNHWFFVFPCFDPKNIGFCCKCSLKPIRFKHISKNAAWIFLETWSILEPFTVPRLIMIITFAMGDETGAIPHSERW